MKEIAIIMRKEKKLGTFNSGRFNTEKRCRKEKRGWKKEEWMKGKKKGGQMESKIGGRERGGMDEGWGGRRKQRWGTDRKGVKRREMGVGRTRNIPFLPITYMVSYLGTIP